jgi:hypothetical protein
MAKDDEKPKCSKHGMQLDMQGKCPICELEKKEKR